MMNAKTINSRLFSFLNSSPSPFHAIDTIRSLFDRAGFKLLDEGKEWKLEKGQPYYCIRDDGTLICFNQGDDISAGYRVLGSHSDSPCLKIKPKPDIQDKSYRKIAVEVYGGALLNPWFDRELSIAGRVTWSGSKGDIYKELVDFGSPAAIIPSLAIHLDRNANKEKSINAQKDIIPVVGLFDDKSTGFDDYLKKYLNKRVGKTKSLQILSYDLFLYDYHKPCYTGLNKDFITGSRLDNLLSCCAITLAIEQSKTDKNYMFVCNNHEEVGSTTSSGAQGNLIQTVFERLHPGNSERYQVLANSFFISVDNAHATHPNFAEKHDPGHDIFLNSGPVLKINANQRYTSNALSNAVFKTLCKEVKVPYQEFVMRNDMACGSTIGPITASKLGIQSVDIGVPSLSMHSIRELTGAKDPLHLFKLIYHFLNRDSLPTVKNSA